MMTEREKLLEQLYAADDDAKRLAISQRMLALDKVQADVASDQAMDALSWPMRQTKEAISGDSEEWFSPEGIDPRLYAAGNTALDIVADPVNLIGGGLWGKGAKALNTLGAGAKSAKGMLSANLANYINATFRP